MRGGYFYLDRMFLAVVDKGDCLVLLLDAVDDDTHCAIAGLRAQDGYVVDRFPIPVVQREAFPIRREDRRETQAVNLKPQTQE